MHLYELTIDNCHKSSKEDDGYQQFHLDLNWLWNPILTNLDAWNDLGYSVTIFIADFSRFTSIKLESSDFQKSDKTD